MHELPLLLNIAVALAFALLGGAIARLAGQPPIVGYLLAGVAIGPSTPGFVGDHAAISALAELGVVFLMFGVGLHFSFGDLWRVRNIAVPGAALQMSAATALGFLLTRSWGWSVEAGLILGLAISVASTVVLLRALMDFGALDSTHGRVAVGWLVLQDLATVAILVLLPLLVERESRGGALTALIALGRAAAFVALMLLVGRRVVPWLLRRVVYLKSHELFVLVALIVAIGTALLSARIFGVSLALGAFIAGVVVSESPYSHQVNAELLPFRDAFAVLFFVSVGMLVNPGYLDEHWREVVALAALIIVGNGSLGALIGFCFPYPARTALIVGAGLTQIGEFSFIVGQAGISLGILNEAQYSLILAGSLVSITLNPFTFRLVGPTERMLQSMPRVWAFVNREGKRAPHVGERMRDHVVIVGCGRVGRHIADVLGTLKVPRLIIESDWRLVEQLSKEGVPVLYGDAANSSILEHASLPHARAMVVTVPDEAAAGIVVAAARDHAPALRIIARAATEQGARQLAELGAGELVRPEFEGGMQILRSALLTLGIPARRIQAYADEIREREAAGLPVEDERSLVRKLAASNLELEWVTVDAQSAVAGHSLAEANLRGRVGVSVVAVARGGALIPNPGADLVLTAGDSVAIIGTVHHLAGAATLFRSPEPAAVTQFESSDDAA